MAPDDYERRVGLALESLGIPKVLLTERGLRLCVEADELVVAEIGEKGREHRLVPGAAKAWGELAQAAKSDGVLLKIVSAYRSFDRQVEIVRRKLAKGLSLEAILLVSAPPGYSEHHTGRAVDVTTPDCPPLEEAFEATEAFRWLQANAERFGYHLSYGRGNRSGYAYEPWHWCFRL
ncbi:MAG TPA: M15 family metallopeptidase [Candidatus Polarisedimenticolia bacterium]|nr:M15 family metallopeptidase [Candidatus Polarisedimenticolia bacterium]